MSIAALRRTVAQLSAKADGRKQKAELIICANEREREERLKACGGDKRSKIFVLQFDRFVPTKYFSQKSRTKEDHMSSLSLLT